LTAIERIGIGYDLHPLVGGRPLLLGGIRIPSDRGLAGHSDGDAVLHAVADALLGAAGMGDIGELFPDTDPQFKDADSRWLLSQVVQRVAAQGYRPTCLDLIIHAERPKLAEHKPAIRQSLAELLGLEAQAVNVKAKTNEGLDAVGRGEAIACWACIGVTRTTETGT
jgi:2-C-methyl-D-erythritol 2,4-cyclodiphosphate synthase